MDVCIIQGMIIALNDIYLNFVNEAKPYLHIKYDHYHKVLTIIENLRDDK